MAGGARIVTLEVMAAVRHAPARWVFFGVIRTPSRPQPVAALGECTTPLGALSVMWAGAVSLAQHEAAVAEMQRRAGEARQMAEIARLN
jgi:hypothetical protein